MTVHPFRPLLPLGMLLLAALGCSAARQPDTVVVTATSSSQALLVAATPSVPYVTPTPHIVPTATLPPRTALEDAERALHNGDYASAVEYYEAVLAQPDADPTLRTAAAYGLGAAALREGLYDQAAGAFSDFLVGYPDDARAPDAIFLRGDAYLGLSEWQPAIDAFKRYLELRPGVIDSYVYERIGDAYLALGQPALSLDAYGRAAEAPRETSSLVALRERVAAGYLNAGQPQRAVQQYDAILAVAENAPYRASIQLQAAQVLLGQGDVAGGHTRLQRLVNDYPETAPAYQALRLLLDAGLNVAPLQRAKIAYASQDYQAAIQALNTYTSELGYAPVDVLLMLGRSYRGVGNAAAANTAFQTVIDVYPTDPAYGEAWLEQGRTLFLSGDTAGAIAKYTALATDHPDVAEGAEALWRAGYLYSTQGDTANALATFDILGQSFPGTQWAQEGLYQGATMAYTAGNTGMAAQLFSRLAATGTGEQQAAAYLWVGRLYHGDGKEDLARQAYQAAAHADPGGYYSVRADDLLHGRAPFQPPPNVIFDFDEAADRAEADDWLRRTFSLPDSGPLAALSPALASDARLIRGRELMNVGASTTAYQAAEAEFAALREANKDDPVALYQLAIYFRDLSLFRLSIESAARLLTVAEVATTDAPGYIARLRYPVYYRDLVQPAAAEQQLDPLLIFALIRQESLFEGFATSYAAAQGLMQIIPDTGYWIAQRLGWPNYRNSDVYRPHVNVVFGTYYLRWALDNLDDQIYAALAGYNGGPGNAAQWLGVSGPDLDLFVQTIDLDETRLYVRRIYEHYHIYRALYGADAAG